MLTEEEKARLRREEIFRLEVRAELERKKKGQWWSFVNAPIFLWVLSSVVIGLGTLAYNKHEISAAAERSRIELARKLDAEISRRVAHFQSEIGRVEANNFEQGRYREALATLTKPTSWIFPEYKKRPLSSILWELQSILADDDRAKVTDAYTSVKALEESMPTPSMRIENVRDKVSEAKVLLSTTLGVRGWQPSGNGERVTK